MSASFSKENILRAVGYAIWVSVAFIAAQLIVVLLLLLLKAVGINVKLLNATVLETILAAASYIIAIAVVFGIPAKFKQVRLTKKDIGFQRLMSWNDIGLGLVAFIPYLILAGILTYVATQLFPAFQANQAQNVGFKNIVSQGSALLAFVTLVIMAPVAEETLFRGYLYGQIRKHIGVVGAVLLTSLTFAALHFQLNVGIDVFALSIMLCILREMTGSIWAGIILHMAKNAIAFYVLFVMPMMVH